jgi:hypothetical protein
MTERKTIFSQGIDNLMMTAEAAVDHCFSDADEIGTSDVNCCLHDIVEAMGVDADLMTENEWTLLRNFVQNKINEA